MYRWGRYLRVSTEEQALPGTASIPAQDADTLALIQREGGVLVDTYQDTTRYRSGGRLVEPSGERAARSLTTRRATGARHGPSVAVSCPNGLGAHSAPVA